MSTIIERDSSGPASLLVFVVVLLLLAGGAWFAYTNGVFGGKTTVIENNKTVEVAAPAAPASAPEAPKP
ncbi:hypothetical protein OAG63_00345 [Methylacidiphilales bacterium]|nr:hypothetical protein [Candidatus Methylacidiphilales bacterium]